MMMMTIDDDDDYNDDNDDDHDDLDDNDGQDDEGDDDDRILIWAITNISVQNAFYDAVSEQMAKTNPSKDL